jgi:hypothetical protein
MQTITQLLTLLESYLPALNMAFGAAIAAAQSNGSNVPTWVFVAAAAVNALAMGPAVGAHVAAKMAERKAAKP